MVIFFHNFKIYLCINSSLCITGARVAIYTSCVLANFSPVVRIFRNTRAENTSFTFLSQERKWYFRPGYGEKSFSPIMTTWYTRSSIYISCKKGPISALIKKSTMCNEGASAPLFSLKRTILFCTRVKK